MVKITNKSKKVVTISLTVCGIFMVAAAIFLITTGDYNISFMFLGSGFVFFSLAATPEFALSSFSESKKVQFTRKSKTFSLVAVLIFALFALFLLITGK
jgi:hypothetical protein